MYVLVDLQAGLGTCTAANTQNLTQYWYTCRAKNENQETEKKGSDSFPCIQSVGYSAHTAFGTKVQKIWAMSSLRKCDTAMARIKTQRMA